MKKLFIKKPLVPHIPDGAGVYSFIVTPEKVRESIGDLDFLYARKNLCLRVFVDEPLPLKDMIWGSGRGKDSNKLIDCTQIQNLAAIRLLAPRVYDIVLVPFRGQDRYAQVCDYLEGEYCASDDERNDMINKIREAVDEYGAAPVTIDPNPKNIKGGKYTDFQLYRFNDRSMFTNKVMEKANHATDWGSKTGISYESVEELGIEGQRNTKRRAGVLKMDDYDFKGKTVLDVGCSTGSFCRYAARRGAKRVVGLDIGDVPKAATEISIYLKDFNIDYYNLRFNRDDPADYERIKELSGIDTFDCVFFLSVNAQVGYPTTYMKDLCGEIMFLEGHSADQEETYRDKLEADFKKVEFMGRMRNNARPAFRCYK